MTSANSSASPADNSPKATGRFGLGLIAFAALATALWLGARVVSTLSQNKAIESKRAQSTAPIDAVPEVKLAPISPATWSVSIPIEGTIEAKERSELGFKVGGRLSQIEVSLGDRVKAGKLLGRLDAGEAAAQRSAASAQVEAARAQLAMAEDQERRTSQLVQSGAMNEAVGVQAEQQRALARAQASAAQAQLGLAATSLSNHVLTAPFDGVVSRAPTTRGAVVAPGQPLFEVVNDSELRLRGSVSEGDAGLVKVGATVTVNTVGGSIQGKIRAIVSVLDGRTRRIPVEADLMPSPHARVGSFVRAEILGDESAPVLRVPGSALRPGSQNVVLAVVDGNLVEKSLAFSVEPASGDLMVRSGLTQEDHIVLAPRPEAKAGDRVNVVP